MSIARQAPEPSGFTERINTLEGEIVLLNEQLKEILIR
jgi:hypothetical protein